MKKFKFTITNVRYEVVEAESANDARMFVVNREIASGKGSPDDYIDDGVEINRVEDLGEGTF